MSARKVLLIPVLFMVILAGVYCDLDIGFIIDSSGFENPTNTQNWNTIKEFLASVIDGLPRWCTQVGAVAFSDRVDFIHDFDSFSDPYVVRDILLEESLPRHSNLVDLSEALYTANTQLFTEGYGDRENAVNVAVVITHRRSDLQVDRTIFEAQELHQRGINIISIGITNKTDENELREISSPSHVLGSDYFKVPDFSGLDGIRTVVTKKIQMYERTSIPPCGCDEGTHAEGLSFQQDLDIVFIIDGSDSGEGYNWVILLGFISDLIDSFPRFSTRVGAVIFSDKAMVEFTLNKFTDMCYAKQEIKFAQGVGGKTNTSGGLYIAHTQLFNEQNGDRETAPNVAIVITDGQSEPDEDKTLLMAKILQQNGVKTISIGVTDQINEKELKEISSPPHLKNMNYFTVSNFNDLGEIIDVLLMNIDISQNTTGEATGTNLILYVVVPVLSGLLIVAVVLIAGCVLYRRRRVAGTEDEATRSNNVYENHHVSPKTGMEKDAPCGFPVYDEAAKAYIYEEAAPAHIYNDASSAQPHPHEPTEQDGVYSNATDVHPPIYDLAEPSDGAYSQVTPGTVSQQPKGKETLSSQVQRKRSYIYAQVQKKKSYIYAQVNKAKKRNVDGN